MGRRSYASYMPRVKKEKPPNLRLAEEFWTHQLSTWVTSATDKYVFAASLPLEPRALGRFIDTHFAPAHLREVASKAWALLDSFEDIRPLSTTEYPLDDMALGPPMRVRVLHFPDAAGKGVLLRAAIPSFMPLANPGTQSDPRYNATWKNPFAKDKLAGIPFLLSPDSTLVWSPEKRKVIDDMIAWVLDSLLRQRSAIATRTFIRDTVRATGSVRALCNFLPGLRDILRAQPEFAHLVDDITMPVRGKDTIDSVPLRIKYPLFASEWSNTHRPTLVAMALANKIGLGAPLEDAAYTIVGD